ncbi:uncharacterized protein SRS1_16554 [Sporisorium reilianum f. sp. reilianum]|uniref:Uncharacterized protein n=1 Tax=Sporisorium reilianum f. sp. reilianum TaxID=72559 RepID=A0A2N8UCD0_9BASI|nr:uncharacterized protein SRS1_16554 [Sporisorium reilianum f. sp. reilianum]
MILIFRLAGFLTLVTLALAVSSKQPKLSEDGIQHYTLHWDTIWASFPENIRPSSTLQTPDLYLHLLALPDRKEKIWSFARTEGNGPAHVSDGRHSNRYMTTKIPGDSVLGREFGFDHSTVRQDGSRDHKDLYAFWRRREDGTLELMRLEAWPRGGYLTQILPWPDVVFEGQKFAGAARSARG